ncbi:MAG: adenylate/guanylate cyclase domain-containing protein [Bacteroidota bacterium]
MNRFLIRLTFLLIGVSAIHLPSSQAQVPSSENDPDQIAQVLEDSVAFGAAAEDSIPLVEIEHFFKEISMNAYLRVHADTSGLSRWNPDQIASLSYVPRDSLAYPRPQKSKLWARFRLRHQLPDSQEFVLYTTWSDHLTLRIWDGTTWTQQKSGYYSDLSGRSITVGQPRSFLFTLKPDHEYTFYLEVYEKRRNGVYLGASLYTYSNWLAYFYQPFFKDGMLLSFFIGVFVILFFYNLIVFISIRERTYFYYALYLLVVVIAVYSEMMARIFPTLLPSDFLVRRVINLGGLASISLAYLLFGRSFVNSRELTPRWDKVLSVLIGIRVILIVIMVIQIFWDQFYVSWANLIIGVYGIEFLVLLPYFVVLIRTQSIVARFFVAGSMLVFGIAFMAPVLQQFFNVQWDSATIVLIPLLLEVLVFSLGLGYKMRQQQQEKLAAEQALNRELSRVNTAFGRFVPHEFIQSLGHNSVLDVQLGDQVEKEVTVLFSDIRGYTGLSEQMSPAENFRFLNAYLGRMGPIIQHHGGFVNQYYGDGIMALFLGDATQGVSAAADMLQGLVQYNLERQAKGRLPIQLGIGLHTGPLMMGIIGDQLRMEAGVVSDTVNTASRMEGLTKIFGVEMLLSESCYRGLSPEQQAFTRPLGRVLVKGRAKPLAIYEAFMGNSAELQSRKQASLYAYQAGLEAYFSKDLALAQTQLTQALTLYPDDQAAQYYLDRTHNFLQNGFPEDWAGVEVMAFK